MTPAPPNIYKCPSCHKEIRVRVGDIGHSLHDITRLWSDMEYYPEMGRFGISPIIKCSDCGEIFMMNGDGIYGDQRHPCLGEDSWDYGLTMPEIYQKLSEKGLTRNQQFVLLLDLINWYNSLIRNQSQLNDLSLISNNKEFHKSNLLQIIPLLKEYGENARPLIAEFYREAGEFDESLKTIEDYVAPTEYVQNYCNEIRERAIDKDNTVFEMQLPQYFSEIAPLNFITEPYNQIAHVEPRKLSYAIPDEDKRKGCGSSVLIVTVLILSMGIFLALNL